MRLCGLRADPERTGGGTVPGDSPPRPAPGSGHKSHAAGAATQYTHITGLKRVGDRSWAGARDPGGQWGQLAPTGPQLWSRGGGVPTIFHGAKNRLVSCRPQIR